MTRTLLVDADIVAYKFASATEQVYHFDGRDNPPCVDADLGEALALTDQYLDGLADALGASNIIICLTDTANFRLQVWPEYKANRKGARKPEHLQEVKDHFKDQYKTYQRPGLEADDCMGILATHPTLVPGEKVIVSEDKDMQTIPGLLHNPRKDVDKAGRPLVRRIGKLEAALYHLWQTVVGDSSDGYPGARGVGPKSPEAQGILTAASEGEAWTLVKQAYERRGLTEQDAIVQARLARILRAQDWDFKAKRPRPWMPPKSPS